MLAGGTYAADYVQSLLDTNGLTCTLPPEILLNTGTYEGEIFSAQILNTADADSALYDVGLGIRNFAHSFTRLVELNLRAPCDKTTTAGFTLPCDPADAESCGASLWATQKLVETVLPHQKDAKKFKVVADPLGSTTLNHIGDVDTSEGSPFYLNLQGSYIASGGLTQRAPAPFDEYSKYAEVASIFVDAFSKLPLPSLDGVSNTADFWTGYYSALVGFQNWLACAYANTNDADATTLFPIACFNKGGQGVF
jgi:hypothetical protein